MNIIKKTWDTVTQSTDFVKDETISFRMRALPSRPTLSYKTQVKKERNGGSNTAF